jgi:hypothetical protein
LSSQSSKKNIKFSIDGDIQTPKESSYLKDIDKVNAIKFKRRTTYLWIGLFVAIAAALWFYLELNKTSKTLIQFQRVHSEATVTEKIDNLSSTNDSLSLAIAKLKMSNDLLIENFDPSEGIFFEVHMEFSGDFDLQQYKSELAELMSVEYDGREKLVLGRFKSFKKALLFENDLKKLGLKDLFLLGRVDGKIMTFKEALALDQNQNK